MRTRLTGLAALLALAAMVVGVPVLLLTVGGNPLSTVQTWAQLRDLALRPDDGTLLLSLLYVIAWGAWAVSVSTVLVEVIARLRGLPAPQLPGLAWPQGSARLLVSAAAALFFASQPAFALSAPPTTSSTAATLVALPSSNVANPSPDADPSAQTSTPRHATPPISRAAPPITGAPSSGSAVPEPTLHVVRAGETLWSIAENHLGDGARYGEIAEPNYGRVQADGNALDDTHWITPGWQLILPGPLLTRSEGEAANHHQVTPGETLWGIAREELDDGNRWPEIYRRSTSTEQFDGAHLSNPAVIKPGWQLTLPEPLTLPDPSADSAVPIPEVTPTPHIATEPEAATSPGAPSPRSDPRAEPTSSSAATAADESGSDLAEQPSWTTRTISGMGAFAAAGFLSLVAARRRQQMLRRRPGQPLLTLTADDPAVRTEGSLRAVADDLGVETVDLALRTLAYECARSGEPLPPLQVLRVTQGQVEVFLETATALPPPWQARNDSETDRYWRLSPDQVALTRSIELSDLPTPYPALVTIGEDRQGAHLLIDLEHKSGLIVSGRPTSTRAVLAALVVELATSSWADDVHLTIVGDFAGFDRALGSGRVRYLPTLQQALAELETQASADAAALADIGVLGRSPLRTARVRGLAPQTWTPQITVVSTPMTSVDRDRLTTVLALYPGVATAVVCTDSATELDSAVSTWSLALGDVDVTTPDGTTEPAALNPLGIEVFPQLLDEETYHHLTQLASAAEDAPAVYISPVREPRLTELPITVTPRAAHESTSDPANMPAVESISISEPPLDHQDAPSIVPASPSVNLLGPVVIDGARGTVESSKRARLTELIAYLLLHPGVEHVAMDEALWPGRRHEDNLNTRNTATSKARGWLGRRDDGQDYLPRHSAGQGYRLSPDVGSDWMQWQELIGSTVFLATTEQLTQALALVRGRPFEGVHPRRYGWADGIRQQMTAQIVDAAYELGRRKVAAGDWRAAESALIVGLDIEPGWEPLWRLRIMAAYESGNAVVLSDVIARMLTITDAIGSDLEPETLQLLRDVKATR